MCDTLAYNRSKRRFG
nr:hypothetical protein [Trichococcus flocculiformis]